MRLPPCPPQYRGGERFVSVYETNNDRGYTDMYLYIGDHRHAAARRGGNARLTVYITIFSKYTAAADKIGGTALYSIHGEISAAQIPTFNFKPEIQPHPTHSPLHFSPTPSFFPNIEISSKSSFKIASRKQRYIAPDTLRRLENIFSPPRPAAAFNVAFPCYAT